MLVIEALAWEDVCSSEVTPSPLQRQAQAGAQLRLILEWRTIRGLV